MKLKAICWAHVIDENNASTLTLKVLLKLKSFFNGASKR